MVDKAQFAGGGDETAGRLTEGSNRSVQVQHEPGRRLFVGAMSGTSADGVDVALVSVAGRGDPSSLQAPPYACQLLQHHHLPYSDWIKKTVFGMRRSGGIDLKSLARLARDTSICHAQAVNELLAHAGVSPSNITAIAAHGQTLFHEPPCTVQWLDPSLIAAQTGCTVVSDFRRADCAVGGQGAPLVPFADYILFRSPHKSRVLLNIGGIANVTYLPAGGEPESMLAFDTGPGNCISDHLMRLYDPEGSGYDAGGAMASTGNAIYPLMHLMLNDPYFAAAGPKSTDGPAMIDLFAKAYDTIGRKFPFENLLKTACMLTAITIADAIRRFDPFPDELIISGGGCRNEAIMAMLRQPMGDLPIRRTDELGVPSEAKEAMAFALLGAATIDGVPGNVPTATGAKKRVVLGSITPRG